VGADDGNAAPPPAAAAAAPAAAWSGPSGVDQLHLMAVRSRLAQLIAWRDAAARAGELTVWLPSFWLSGLHHCCHVCCAACGIPGAWCAMLNACKELALVLHR
jgi:hypothetical protein